MKPEATAYLAKAKELRDRAPDLLSKSFSDEAGRAAYLAGFHVAQALIFEKAGRTPKTHSGVQTEFARLTKDEPAIDSELRAFLGRAYNLKAIADYETGPGSNVTHDQAEAAIFAARRFVAEIEKLIGS